MADERNDEGVPIIDQGPVGEYALGCLPPDGIDRHPLFGDYYVAIPRSQWQPMSARHFQVPIQDQGRSSSCAGQASAGTAMGNRARARWKFVGLNAYSIYAIVNGGRDAGATMGQVLDAGRKYGIGPSELFLNRVIYRNSLTREQLQSMLKYRFTETYKLNSFEEAGTALTLGFDIAFGIAVGANFGNLDDEAIAPLPDRIIGGHALRADGLKRSRRYGDWVLDTVNSWTPQWGDQGRCYLRQEHFDPKYGFGFDAFAVMYTQANPEDVGDLPAVP